MISFSETQGRGLTVTALFFSGADMARPGTMTDKVFQEIIERVSCGETLVAVCEDSHIPTLRTLMRHLAADDAKDDRMHRARVRGTLCQADEAVKAQQKIIRGDTAEYDPKHLQAVVTAANNMGHQANAKLTRIDKRYKDKQEVTHTGPMVFGWQDEAGEAEKPVQADQDISGVEVQGNA